MPPNPANVPLILVVLALLFGGMWLSNHLLDILDKSRKNKLILPRERIDRLFYAHLKYGDTLGWTITHSPTEPRKRKTYVERRVQTTTKQLPSPSED